MRVFSDNVSVVGCPAGCNILIVFLRINLKVDHGMLNFGPKTAFLGNDKLLCSGQQAVFSVFGSHRRGGDCIIKSVASRRNILLVGYCGEQSVISRTIRWIAIHSRLALCVTQWVMGNTGTRNANLVSD